MTNANMDARQGMTMHLQTWRGYSAYEIAVHNGFEGTEEQWLNSLKGSDGQTTSVNGVKQFDGDVAISGADIPVSASDSRRLSELAAPLDKLTAAVSVTEDSVDLGGRYIDNALFR